MLSAARYRGGPAAPGAPRDRGLRWQNGAMGKTFPGNWSISGAGGIPVPPPWLLLSGCSGVGGRKAPAALKKGFCCRPLALEGLGPFAAMGGGFGCPPSSPLSYARLCLGCRPGAGHEIPIPASKSNTSAWSLEGPDRLCDAN